MNERNWTEDDREEYDAMCSQAWAAGPSTRARIDAFVSMLLDARQAHREWAFRVEDEALRRGASSLLTRWNKARNQVAVSYDGQVLSKPRAIGTERTDEAGNRYATQTLFDFMSWSELSEKKREYLTQIRAYSANVAVLDRLLALRELAPGAATPAEACDQLGTTVEAWLAEDAA